MIMESCNENSVDTANFLMHDGSQLVFFFWILAQHQITTV
jgi:hypothetical protein